MVYSLCIFPSSPSQKRKRNSANSSSRLTVWWISSLENRACYIKTLTFCGAGKTSYQVLNYSFMPIGLDACRKVRRQSAGFFVHRLWNACQKNCQILDKTASAKWRAKGEKSGWWRSFLTKRKFRRGHFWCDFPNAVSPGNIGSFDHWRNRVKVFLRFTFEYISIGWHLLLGLKAKRRPWRLLLPRINFWIVIWLLIVSRSSSVSQFSKLHSVN